MSHIVIIGNGIAGITAAREIRKQLNDRITVIADETDYFFSRPALMYVYMGHMKFQHTQPYENWFWTKNRITLVRAQVNDIDFTHKTLKWEQGQITYDTLILAVGSRSKLGGWPGEQLRGVQGLYGKQDLNRMEADTKHIRQAVVVGGGLLGIELCEMLRSREIHITFLIRETSFWNSVLPAEESALVTQHLRENEIEVCTSTELTEICDDGTGRVGSVRTTNGETILAQFVGVAVGISPNIDLLKNSNLETDVGILVNEYLETNLPDVYAIGSCVQHRNSLAAPRKSVEQMWYTGRLMGETVAQTVAGKRTRYQPGVFFNSAKFINIEYQTYGYVTDQSPWVKSTTIPGAELFLPNNGTERTFYWQHDTQNIALRISYRTADSVVTGMHALGVRQRQEVWQQWIAEEKTVKYVLEHLPQANFDPEFTQQNEGNIIAKYNAENPYLPVTLLRRGKGLM